MLRQAAARDPTLHWDTIKEDMSGPSRSATTLNFSRTPPLFVTNSQYQLVLGPQQLSQANNSTAHYIHCRRQKKSASCTMQDAAQGGRNASSHTSDLIPKPQCRTPKPVDDTTDDRLSLAHCSETGVTVTAILLYFDDFLCHAIKPH